MIVDVVVRGSGWRLSLNLGNHGKDASKGGPWLVFGGGGAETKEEEEKKKKRY